MKLTPNKMKLDQKPLKCTALGRAQGCSRRARRAVSAALLVWLCATTSSLAQETRTLPGLAFEDFKQVTQRNIFDTTRRPPSATPQPRPRNDPPPVRTQEFALKGALVYDNEAVAFFDGNESGFRKALRRNEKIGAFTITEISQNQVVLDFEGEEFNLPINMRMVRRGDEAWQMAESASASSSTRSSSRSSSRSAPAEDEDVDDILQKLMQQRNQELNK